MGQKVHPTSLRLYKTNRQTFSAWFSQLYYKETFLKDWFLRKTTLQLFQQSKYTNPKIFTSFWNRSCDIFIFFFSKRKQYKKIGFRFQSYLQKKSKKKKETPPFFLPGKKNPKYLSFIKKRNLLENAFGEDRAEKTKIQRLLCQKLNHEKKYQ